MGIQDLVFELIAINEQIDTLRAQKRKVEADLKAARDEMMDWCGRTGKTRKDVKEWQG